jgi:hypothetical protein
MPSTLAIAVALPKKDELLHDRRGRSSGLIGITTFGSLLVMIRAPSRYWIVSLG